MQSKANYKVLK